MDRTLADIQAEMRSQLAPIYSGRELQQIVFELLEHFGFTRVQAIAYPDAKISETDYQRLQAMLKIYDVINKYPGANTREKVEAYLKDCGLTDSDIAMLRAIILE